MNEIRINTYLAGVRRFLASARSEAAALAELGLATKGVGYEMERTTRRSWLMNQSLFTARRLVYGVTLGLIAAGGAAFKLGNDYNNAMQTARVALAPFFSDTQSLNKALNQLWTIAKFTPFQIKDMTLAFRGLFPALQGTGITADQLVFTIKNLIDALSVAGQVTPQALGRISYALQHMLFQGRLTGRTVQQLAASGIPIFRILQDELGITADQLHHIATLGIPAADVLQAINTWITQNPAYANAALRQSQKTVVGLLSTFRDNVSKTMGLAEKGWFRFFQRTLVGMNSFFNRLQAQQERTGDLFKALDATLTPRSHAFIRVWRLVTGAFHDAWTIFRAIVTTLATSRPLWYTVGAALVIIASALHVAAATTGVWVPILKALIPLLIAYFIWTKGIALYERIYWQAVRMSILWDFRKARMLKLLTTLQTLYTLAVGKDVITESGRIRSFTKLERVVINTRKAFLALWVAMRGGAAAGGAGGVVASGPIGWIIAAVVLLVASLVILYFRWKAFHDLINRTARWLYSHWYILALVPVVGPFIAGILLMIRHLRMLTGWAIRLVHWLGRIHAPHIHVPGIGLLGHLPHLQGGGSLATGGSVLVGERGPEILTLPRGASVTPMGMLPPDGWRRHEQPIQVRLVVDGRTLAEVVARHQTAVNARR